MEERREMRGRKVEGKRGGSRGKSMEGRWWRIEEGWDAVEEGKSAQDTPFCCVLENSLKTPMLLAGIKRERKKERMKRRKEKKRKPACIRYSGLL